MVRFGLLLIGLSSVTSTAAFAENWRVAGGNRDALEYVDLDSIVRNGVSIRYWRETRYNRAQSIGSDLRFDRLLVLYMANCRDRNVRAMRVTARLGDRVVNSYESTSGLEYPEPGSVGESVFLSVCDNRWPN
jgi:hypothetical protein